MKIKEKLTLGCGKDIKKDFINLDISKLPGVDVVHNLEKYPWPFKDNQFKYIYCDNVLEHLSDIIRPLEEIHRISKKGALIEIIVPFTPSIWAFCDPTHKSFYTYMTLDYFEENNSLNYYSKARFKIISKKIIFNKFHKFLEPIVNICPKIQKAYILLLNPFFPGMFLKFKLKAIK